MTKHYVYVCCTNLTDSYSPQVHSHADRLINQQLNVDYYILKYNYINLAFLRKFTEPLDENVVSKMLTQNKNNYTLVY